jgi:hypothetical protein
MITIVQHNRWKRIDEKLSRKPTDITLQRFILFSLEYDGNKESCANNRQRRISWRRDLSLDEGERCWVFGSLLLFYSFFYISEFINLIYNIGDWNR